MAIISHRRKGFFAIVALRVENAATRTWIGREVVGCGQSEKSTIVVLLRVKLKLERRLLTLTDQWIELVLLLL